MPTPFVEDEAFANVVAHFADAGGMTKEIVLLGDFMDLVTATTSAGPGDPAVRKLDAIVAAHPRAVAALADFVGHRHVLHIVPGNHDAALLRRPVQDRLRAAVAGALGPAEASARVVFASWVFDVRGVVSAELGQQHHDINHSAHLLDGASADGRDDGAAAGPVPRRVARRRRPHDGRDRGRPPRACRGAGARTAAPGAAGVRRLRGRPRPSRASDDRRPASGASAVAGTRTACGTMPAISTSRPTRSWRSIGAPGDAALDRPPARAGPDDYMLAAARTVHARLRTPAGAAMLYVFGHTRSRAAAASTARRHPGTSNAGTWSTMVRAGRPPASDRLRLVEIEHGDALPPTARLLQ